MIDENFQHRSFKYMKNEKVTRKKIKLDMAPYNAEGAVIY